MREIKAPNMIGTSSHPSVFLAGSIDMGAAEDWQAVVSKLMAPSGWTLLNPRRSDWDSSWKQDIQNPVFYEQVEWELNALERADVILMYFAPGSQSPISLLELGLFAASGRMIVVCPEGFWRKGNVDIVCQHYGVKQMPDIERAVAYLLSQGV